MAELNFNDDKVGKPVGIHQQIGKRPVFTGGNSDGDYAMMQCTSTGIGARFGLLFIIPTPCENITMTGNPALPA